jgi:hypothetical protein
MADLSTMSDEDLQAIAGGGAAAPAPSAASVTTAAPDLSSISDEDLAKLASAAAPTGNIIPAGMGQPGLSSDPLAGLPHSLSDFLGGSSQQTAPAASPAPARSKAWSGNVLPVSADAEGHVSFDPKAGLLGAAINAFTLPHDALMGEVDPTSSEGMARVANMASFATPLNPAVRAGELAIPGAASAFKPATVAAPTAEALRAAAQANYDTAGAAGVHYASPAVSDMAGVVQSSLNDKGILSVLAPKTHSILDDLQAVPAGDSTVPFSSLDAARKAFGHAARDFTNPTEQKAAAAAQSAIDDFVDSPPDGAVVAGDASAAADAVQDARGNYAAAMRSDTLQGIEEKAELSAAAANSGQNIGNAIRQRVKSLLFNPKLSAGFSDDEIAALNQVVRGSTTNNTARVVGNLLGGGGGMHAGLLGVLGEQAGEHLLGPAGALLGAGAPLIGAAAKHVDNAATQASLTAADALVRKRSPLYRQTSASAPMTFANPERQAVLARALALTSGDQNQPQRATGGRVEPTEAQKAVGNYKKDHLRVHGLDVTIENPKGSWREGVGSDGKKWRVRMQNPYGYIRGHMGADDDHLDCYVGPDEASDKVTVIDQKDLKTGKFDECKVMLGFKNRDAAIGGYTKGFSDGNGAKRIMKITPMSVEAFKAWLASGRTREPMGKAA